MVGKRSYDDGCRVAHALDLVGERWALLVVRELLLGPKRFTDLRAGLPGASSAVLSQRLRELEHSGVLYRRKLPPPAAAQVYALTEWGSRLEPIIIQLGLWGSQSPTQPKDAPIGADSMVLSLRARFDPAAAETLTRSYELRFGEDRFWIEMSDRRLEAGRGTQAAADLIIDTCPITLDAVVSRLRSAEDAVRTGDVRLVGSLEDFDRFLDSFPSG